MDFKKNSVSVNFRKTICEKTNVHPLSASFILPDYFPDVSRIMKVYAKSSVTSWNVKDKKISYEINVSMSVIYKSSESTLLQSYSQTQTISGSAELESECDNPVCIIKASSDSIICRAKSERRLEFEGSVIASVKLWTAIPCELLCDYFGNSIHTKKNELNCIENISAVSKDFTFSEEITVNDTNISGASVLHYEILPEISEIGNVSGKALIKGVLNTSIIYTFTNENEDNISAMKMPIPFSRVMDLKDSENSSPNIEISVSDLICRPVNDSKGCLKHFEISCRLKAYCISCTYKKAQYIEDIYSTKYKLSTAFSHFISFSPQISFDSVEIIKSSVPCGNLKKIYNFTCNVKSLHSKADPEDNNILSEGIISAQFLARDENGSVVINEKEIPFEIKTKYENLSENTDIECNASIKHCGYTLSSDDKAETETEIKLNFRLSEKKTIKAVTEINIDESEKSMKNDNIAFRVCFADAGESIWNIAKKYGTDSKAIMESNSLTNDILDSKQALLIPMTD